MRLPACRLVAHIKAITYCLLCLPIVASIDPAALDASIITGAFYTDQEDISGTVIPWRLVLNYNQKFQHKNELAIRMNSQTGITVVRTSMDSTQKLNTSASKPYNTLAPWMNSPPVG